MKIYDCFPFFNEYDVLELRFRLLSNVVDYFVIVESNVTQRGMKKEYNFENNQQLFSKFKEKIIYIKVDDCPNQMYEDNQTFEIWDNENFQRNCIMRALTFCKNDDLIMISDVDEIPNPEVIKQLFTKSVNVFSHADWTLFDKIKQLMRVFGINRKLLRKEVAVAEWLNYAPIVLEQDFFYYFLNWKRTDKWYGTTISLYKNMLMPQVMRNKRTVLPYLKNGGWHFSYLGGAEKIYEKIINTADKKPYIPTLEEINISLDKGNCIFEKIGNLQFNYLEKTDICNEIIEKFIDEKPDLFRRVKK